MSILLYVYIFPPASNVSPDVPRLFSISLFFNDIFQNGLAAGFSLAPTSVGISLTLLSRAKQLNSRNGQIIMSAAFLDDIYSIICLVVLTNLGKGNLNPVNHVVIPLISSFAFVGFGAVGSVYLPLITPYLFDDSMTVMTYFRAPNRTLTLKDEMQLFVMIVTYLMLSWVGNLIGSSLLGGFVAGMLFASVPRAHLVWEKQFKRINRWLLRIFFSCTVAFSINIGDLFTVQAFWKGCVIGLIPCLLTKLVSGAFTGPGRWVIGIAMMARGEFAYLVAETAHDLEMIDAAEYAVVVWALLWATIVAPFAFDKVLKKFVEDQFLKSGSSRSDRIGGNKFSGQSSFVVRYFGVSTGMVREVTEGMYALGFDVEKSSTESSQGFGMGTFEVFPRQAAAYKSKYGDIIGDENSMKTQRYKMATDLTDDKLDEIAHYLKEAIGDENAQISFEPSDSTRKSLRILEIKVFGEKHRTQLKAVAQVLEDQCHLVIVESMVVDPDKNTTLNEYTMFYCTKESSGGTDHAAEKETSRFQKTASMRRITTSELDEAADKHGLAGAVNRVKSSDGLITSDTVPSNVSAPANGNSSHSVQSTKPASSDSNHSQPPTPAASSALTSDSITEHDVEFVRDSIEKLYRGLGLNSVDVMARAIHEDAVVYVGDVDTTYDFEEETGQPLRRRSATNLLGVVNEEKVTRPRRNSKTDEEPNIIMLDRRISGSTIDISRRMSNGKIDITKKLTFGRNEMGSHLQSAGVGAGSGPKGTIAGLEVYKALHMGGDDEAI